MTEHNPYTKQSLIRLVERVVPFALLLLPLMVATPSKAFGYVDPGSGAFVYQAAYAVFLGGSFYLRKVLDRIWGKRK